LTRVLSCLLLIGATLRGADPLVFIGTYTDNGSKGIYAFRMQTKTGKLTPLGLAVQTTNPSFLVENPDHRFLYAVNENGSAAQMGSVSAFSIDPQSGKLTLLNWVSSRGGAPCHLAFDRTGRWLAVANYEGASIAVLPVAPDGKLGSAVWYAKTGGHAHSVAFSPDNRFLLTADLGLDRIFVYRFDQEKGSITPNATPFFPMKTGSGLRHLAFHPSGRMVYTINERSSTVSAFEFDGETGTLREAQTVPTLPGFAANNNPAELALNKDGTMLYVSNRGHDSIYSFEIDPKRFTLTPAGDIPTFGSAPRHFAIDPSGQYLLAANQTTNDLAMFKVNKETGLLTPAGKLVKDVPQPVCVLFVE
jgi:6-phosphogluconolactonase